MTTFMVIIVMTHSQDCFSFSLIQAFLPTTLLAETTQMMMIPGRLQTLFQA
jgi:hypothetical protein